MKYSDKEIEMLKNSVALRMSEKRFLHTMGVVFTAERLGKTLLPEKISELKAAALLHDVSKELPVSKHIEILLASNEE